MLRHYFVTLCLNAGLSVAKQTNKAALLDLLQRLHPISTEHPLIRIGNEADGTYLVPNDLVGIAGCFSPGVSNRASFEEFFLARNVPCFLADASVDGPPIRSPILRFDKKFLGTVNDQRTITMKTWIEANALSEEDLVLQMDIEGAEWIVLLDTPSKILDRFRIIVVEFHDMERLFDKHAFYLMKSVFDKILDKFDLLHSHPNNYGSYVQHRSLKVPRALEMTFLRKDRSNTRSYTTSFPHPLDIINAPHLPEVPLPEKWFRSDRKY